jgi:transcriptional regulator with XRE-family HTH domain
VEITHNKQNFIALLKSFRERKKLNKTQLAAAIGVSTTSTIKYEDEKSPNKPGPKTLAKICLVLGLSDSERQMLYQAASLTGEDVHRMDVIVSGLASVGFSKSVGEVLRKKDMVEILERLAGLEPLKQEEALRSLRAFMVGFG